MAEVRSNGAFIDIDKKKKTIARSILSISLLFLPSQLLALEDLPSLIKKTRPATVTIATLGFGSKLLRQGSGFFITNSGHIITNRHVIEGGIHLKITTSDGKKYNSLKFVAVDFLADLVRVLLEEKGRFTPLKLSSRLPKVGERIVVVGSPLGLEQTASEGIISGIREIPGMGLVYQLTAPISPGSSGSPVIDMHGEVIGVATLQVTKGQNLNFAVPSTRVLALQPAEETLLIEWSTMLSPELYLHIQSLVDAAYAEAASGNCEEALSSLNSAVALYWKNGPAWALIGACSKGQEAIEAFQWAIKYGEDDDANIYKLLGLQYSMIKDYERAITAFIRAKELNPSNSATYRHLGFAYGKIGSSDKAVDMLRRAIVLDPDDDAAYAYLATTYFIHGRYDVGLPYIKKAIALKPDNISYREASIVAYLGQRDGAAAYREYKILKQLSPEAAQEFKPKLRRLGYYDK